MTLITEKTSIGSNPSCGADGKSFKKTAAAMVGL